MTSSVLNMRLGAILQLLRNRNDLVFSILIVTVVFMMILPVPPEIMDALIAVNMCASITLLMVSMYVSSPLSFSSFPSVLLITTLFRLSISVSTTRMILLHADAGHIIETFGNFVVTGNLVVGLVVFIILTIVQFVVITKGAERVAEVAARFSLDAMPGKQMAIDGDMRAGSIDSAEAKRRRSNVEKESQLYGAMDGAMKFVKGDAIAGILIVVVNLLGGMIIGISQKGMSFSESGARYAVLSIGDGLVAQIPALLIAITAGLIVTRVSGTGSKSSNVGADISAQISAQPRALLIGAIVMLGFALVPGMPSIVFIILGVVIGGLGFIFLRKAKLQAGLAESEAGMELAESKGIWTGTGSAGGVPFTVPLRVMLAPSFYHSFDHDHIVLAFENECRKINGDIGIPLPNTVVMQSELLQEGAYCIQINEVTAGFGVVLSGRCLVQARPEELDRREVVFERGELNFGKNPSLWIRPETRDVLKEQGLEVLEPLDVVIRHFGLCVRRNAGDFLGVHETSSILAALEDKMPGLVKEVQRVLPVSKANEILKRLVSEDITIRNIKMIMEALVEWGQKEKDTVLLTEYIRSSQRNYISDRYSDSKNVLHTYMLAPDMEDIIRNAIRQTSAGSYLALDPDMSKNIMQQIEAVLLHETRTTDSVPPVLLTSMDVRRYVKKMIEPEFPDQIVLSFQELTQNVKIHTMGRIKI
ncbi:MAG: type III secretion system export apparatus subunit SctV [Parvibaculaceae bacterium]|nr:type III secretion system export apparatus subunit SctV [Parvibaculaceae bacterium]